jgi:cytochrome c551/c552
VGAYTGLHRPNPAEEHLQYIAANKHVDCADCHDPHRSKRGNQGDGGTVTAGVTGCTNTTTTLCNTAATWPVDAWKGYFLDIYNATTGAIIGNRVQITANTATQLTLASTTGTAPASGNAYRISMRANGGAVTAATTSTITDTQSAVGGAKAWATNAFAGWYVHIVFGVGIGQTAPILSNTATQLTINGTWTTTPTTASRYVISKMPNVMLGASGANVTAWGTQTPSAWGETKTFNPAAGSITALPDATTQWQACFKCHSAANTALATWSSSYTDLAQDFNPRNQSYHPVIAPSATNATSGYGNTILTAADMTNGWKPGDMMTCTDCHGNDDQGTGASHGPHASAVKYILKGPNTRWPTQANGTTRWTYNNRTTGQGTADGLFCLNCHSATLRSTPHSNRSDHMSIACTGCHLRLPHGGKVKRLIRTTNTPASYADTGVAASLSAYNGGTSTNSCAAGCTSSHSATNLPANTTTAPVNAW